MELYCPERPEATPCNARRPSMSLKLCVWRRAKRMARWASLCRCISIVALRILPPGSGLGNVKPPPARASGGRYPRRDITQSTVTPPLPDVCGSVSGRQPASQAISRVRRRCNIVIAPVPPLRTGQSAASPTSASTCRDAITQPDSPNCWRISASETVPPCRARLRQASR